MKLETIKKDKKKHIIIGSMIVLSVVGCLTLTTTRAKYRNVQSLKLASGTVKLNQYDFKIMAMKQSEDGENYTDIYTMPESGYVINEDKSYCTTDNKTQVKGKLKTNSYGEHVFSKLNKDDKCYIWFDRGPTGAERLIASFDTYDGYKGTATPTFTSVATGAETEANNGIYKVSDGMYSGYSYYWRGAATTNHVIFDSKCWRIVRINGNKSIRLIYNGTPSGTACPGNGSNSSSIALSGTAYNSSYNNSKYVGWTYASADIQRPSTTNPQTSGTAAPIKIAIENWYSSNISAEAKAKVDTNGKFCNDRNTKNNETWRATGSTQYYAAYARLIENKTPTLSCPVGDIYSLDVGMITADEVTYAGASGLTENKSYYLYNGRRYWTMSPYYWWGRSWACMFTVNDTGGYKEYEYVQNTFNVRPVINLRSDVTFNSGSDGTQNNPYIVQ